MSFTGKENCTVSLATAHDLNENFRNNFPDQPLGVYFSQKTLNEVLCQTSCVGIRFYFACDDAGQLTLTFAGVTSNEDDILGIIGDGGLKCPPSCGASNPLNS
jgi:hypothetical protein